MTLIFFWDSQGVILEHYLESDTTVKSVRYSEMLSTELKPAIRTKHRSLLSSGVLLLHDNARPHTAIHTLQTLVKLGFMVLEHPAYSPDIAPSDYHRFGPLKDALRVRRFTSDEGVKEAVHEWLAAQPKTFFGGASRSFWNAGTSVLQSTGTILKNYIIVRSVLLLK